MTEVVLSGERRIYYETRGDAGPVVVFLNGMSQSTANWRTQARHFSARFRCVMYDARGQGRSPLGAGPVTLDGHVEDLLAVIDAVTPSPVVLCGFSHGSRIALAFAAAYPERVARLVLTSMGDADDPLRRTIVRSWVEILRLGGVEAMAWCAIPDILGRAFLGANEGQIDAMVRATVQRNSPDGLPALLAAMDAFPPPTEHAAQLDVPTMLITSPDDLLVSPESAARLAEQISGCVHRVVTGCGHTIPIEKADEWRATVFEFLT